jgi:large subunit ribosomal protein L10
MAKAEKATAVADIAEQFKESTATVVTEYRGLTVANLAAKAIKNFAKDNKALIVKGGYMDGKALSVDEVNRIADLESREVLLAKLAGAMKAKTSQAAALFAAPASQVARLVFALQEKRAAEEGAGAGPAAEVEAPEAEAPSDASAPAE